MRRLLQSVKTIKVMSASVMVAPLLLDLHPAPSAVATTGTQPTDGSPSPKLSRICRLFPSFPRYAGGQPVGTSNQGQSRGIGGQKRSFATHDRSSGDAGLLRGRHADC